MRIRPRVFDGSTVESTGANWLGRRAGRFVDRGRPSLRIKGIGFAVLLIALPLVYLRQ
jgi:hypothetical protein